MTGCSFVPSRFCEKSHNAHFLYHLSVQHLDINSRIETDGPGIALRCTSVSQLRKRRPRNPLPNMTLSHRRDACSDSEERFKDERAREDVITVTSIVTGTRPALHVYFFCWKKRDTLCGRSMYSSARCRTLELFFHAESGETNAGHQALP